MSYHSWPWRRARAKLLIPRAERHVSAGVPFVAAEEDWDARKFSALPPPKVPAAGRPQPEVGGDVKGGKGGREQSERKEKKRKRQAEDRCSASKVAAAASSAAAAPGLTEDEADGIDDIFGGLAAAKQQARDRAAAAAAADAEAEAERAKAARRDARARRHVERDSVFGEEYDPSMPINPMSARVHRFDNPSGLNVYKAHALGLGRGGGTPLCPFDCSCCF
jgi:hypothetical protein